MAITFLEENQRFVLETVNTRYVFQIVYGKFPVHLYYGDKTDQPIGDYRCKDASFAPYYPEYGTSYLADTCLSEYVGFDSGDFRSCSLKIRNADGDCATVPLYTGYRIFDGRPDLPSLPCADADADTQTLEIQLEDAVTGVQVAVYYTLFPKEDVISRYVRVKNGSERAVAIEKCMSLLLDLPDHNYDTLSLCGTYFYEREVQRVPLHHGIQSVYSRRGATSHHHNPFMALCETGSTQTGGRVYGFNFVYSGDFLDEVEVAHTGCTRVQIGLGSENFRWRLESGEEFVSPEAVMTFSAAGIGQMSRNFHAFTRNHILPPEPFDKRPVVLNTWEACYFAIDEAEMMRFAATAAETGIDMLVMDDGWFGSRNHDRAGLGDWWENRDKFPEGLKPFADRVKSHGIKFGIWIEPEMVNPDSELYRAHPDWCLQCRGRGLMESRNQCVLDMGNPAVIAYLKKQFLNTFGGVAIDYFKWDCNRHLSQVASPILPPERQGEAAYRHMLGVYELFRWFRETFPHAMIENCSGGGGRYDLGMMKYSTMIWTSDNTNPDDRIRIQYGSMLGYPATTMSCHVSKHTACEDPKEMEYRWHVALGGALGYELHLPNAAPVVRETTKQQITRYREYEDLILRGEYYALLNPFESNYSSYYYTDGERFLLSLLQSKPEPPRELRLCIPEAAADAVYRDEVTGDRYTGQQLIDGIVVCTNEGRRYSRLWYLVKA